MTKASDAPYELDVEAGGFWISEFKHRGYPPRKWRSRDFLPAQFVWIDELIKFEGQRMFPVSWDGSEVRSRSIRTDVKGHISERDLYHCGNAVRNDENWFEDITRGKDAKAEILVEPISLEAALKESDANKRLESVFDSLRNKLYSGELTGYLDVTNPTPIESGKWAAKTWDWSISGESHIDEIISPDGDLIDEHVSYTHYPVFFKKSEVIANNPIDQSSTVGGESLELSPYIQVAIAFSKKFEIGKNNPSKMEILKDDIKREWPQELGKPTDSKVQSMARFIRWPEHETGGNKKSNPDKV